jgi:hypothetical protein
MELVHEGRGENEKTWKFSAAKQQRSLKCDASYWQRQRWQPWQQVSRALPELVARIVGHIVGHIAGLATLTTAIVLATSFTRAFAIVRLSFTDTTSRAW